MNAPRGMFRRRAQEYRPDDRSESLCRLTADLLDRRSPWATGLCEVTARICTATAESCERLGEPIAARTCRETAEVVTVLAAQLARQ
ncbi:hypothetical protein ACWDOP_16075 [Nocardia sp. NPDC003693]